MCKGRLLVTANVNHPPEELKKMKPKELSAEEYRKFKPNLTVDKTYVEYTIS